jgi:hypothetical protein
VEAQTIGLDDQSQIRPVEIDLVSVHASARLGLGKPERVDDSQEAALEL